MKNNQVEKIRSSDKIINNIFNEIEIIINSNKSKMVYQINSTLVNTYFQIGKVIVENEQNGDIHAEYGKEILKKLSKKLTEKQKEFVYAEEADVLNIALFGMTAKEWRENNTEFSDKGNIRDYTDLLHLVILNNLENK